MMQHAWKRGIETLQRDLDEVFGRRLQSLVAYDAHVGLESTEKAAGTSPPTDIHALAIVESLTFADLSSCATRADGWGKEHVAVPLVLTATEFAHSLDAFPLEFAGIAAHHLLVAGPDPFENVTIAVDDVRRACETQAKSHLIHLREGFVEARGQADGVARLIAASVGSLRTILVNLARLDGVTAHARESLVKHASARLGVPDTLLDRVLAIRDPGDVDRSEALRLYTAYLDATERMAALLDGWKQ